MASLAERFLDSIEAADDLPALSGVLTELVRSLDSVDSTVPEIAAIIRKDPVITAQVLRAANAATYAGYGPVASIHQALLRLGIVRVRRIAILASLYASVPFRGRHIALNVFWRHAVGVVHLKEGVSLFGRLVDIPLDRLAIGLAVRFRPLLLHDQPAVGFGPA